MLDIQLRLAATADLSAINEIYNYYVFNSTCTYQEEPETIDARQAWFLAHDGAHPITVAVVGDTIVGWGSLSRYHPRSAYRYAVENSVYVRHTHLHRGIGRALLADLIDRARSLGHRTMIAGADAEQTASVALHEAMGFTRVAHLKEVGYKFGRWLDVIYMQRML
jgi:L-amino acid N-acyltransferase YncA